ncbi:HAD-superfamily hydrolase, subfamily IA, variant 3 [Cucumis melo var. makuwa]|uniref:HAD-superfamily hydrolase, subfamily IA, variant 3 n=1 Tax=Cucumis melo var. makuwa TaxID=1194695 RepID=A0A5A7V477_CUCMM|nr:HAD-superfamily hydrolase, subfamily IA, variant 3 [Cucumis melo var. makuwa]TYK21172.1 HAD-superfamily hydrolase, subfamily IA, variant 3 [Cucumis melo var. makuwa]
MKVQDFETLFFFYIDLDDTLYPFNTGIATACKKNIEDFLIEKCGFPKTQAPILRTELFKTYGSTLAGLRALGYDIKADDYHGFVHGRLPYDRIKQDFQLRRLLLSIPQRKIIFTNSDMIHATKALSRLGLEGCFEKIICFETMNPNLPKAARPNEFPILLKPSMDAMRIALDVADVDPRHTLFLDDNIRNIAAGKSLGLRTVLVGKTVKSKEADYVVESVHNLVQVIPEIWMNTADSDGDDEMMNRSRNEVDSIHMTAAAAVGA